MFFPIYVLFSIASTQPCCRLRLPPSNLITIETIHASFKVSRDKDRQYDPPGRLRHYDLIILDEYTQVDTKV